MDIIKNSLSILFFLLLSFTTFAIQTEPSHYLIILKGIDEQSSVLDEIFNKEANDSKNIYQKLGFKVIVLSDNLKTFSAANFIATLSNIKNAKEVHILLLHHGIAYSRKGFVIGSTSAAIEGDDFKKSITNLKNNNPEVKVYIPSLSCYSGALANLFSDTMGVMVLPSTGWNRETVLTNGTENTPTANLYKALMNNQDYLAEQFSLCFNLIVFLTHEGILISAIINDDDQNKTYYQQELPLRRTQSELFLETWCDSQKNGDVSTTKPLCTINESAQINSTIPENLKKIMLQEFKNSNTTKINKIRDLYSKVKCDSIPKDDNLITELNNLKTEVSRKFITQLATNLENLTLENYSKNATILQTEDIAKQQLGILPKNKEEKVPVYTQKMLDDYKDLGRNLITTFKTNCLNNSFTPENQFSDNEPGYGNCKTFITYALKPLITTISPQLVTNNENETDATDLKSKLYPSPKTPTDKIFTEFNRNLLNLLKNYTEPIYFEDLIDLLSMNLPSQKEYCRYVKGSLTELANDQACIETFKRSAAEADWLRYLDIYNLSHRTLKEKEQ
ncbi:MAG: hypothetical protein U0T83_09750 [Bacteriovoracaceae bacterium]